MWLEVDLIILNKRAVFLDISVIFSKSSIGKLINSGRELYSCRSFFAKGFTSFLGIVKNRISDADSDAFINKQKTYQPFIDGFKIGSPVRQHIHDIIDTFSTLVTSIPDTKPYSKLYTIVFESK
jgi:hypothetical protein